MKCTNLTQIRGGQDGAIFGNYLFRFGHNGCCRVYDVREIIGSKEEVRELTDFMLDKADIICPHSNSVVFGTQYYIEGDEFPLLYSNIYNNYAKTDDPLRGVCCVYRLFKTENGFGSELVQLIEIGFVEDCKLWKMSPESHGVRPYGNFVIDREKNVYHAFVMREAAQGTRYFSFDLPNAREGEHDQRFGVKKVVLSKEDILDRFDCPHHQFVQGACCHGGLIYSLEGFNNKPETTRPPALRIIDPSLKKQILYRELAPLGSPKEPELIDFYHGKCIFSDAYGGVFLLEFE